METRLRDGARRSVPIGIAVIAFGVSYGVLARAAGMGVWAPIVMSATTFAGSSQFAAASILHTGGSVAAAVAAASLLNARYVPISISVAQLFRGALLRRLVQSQLIVDESWAVSARPEGGSDLQLLLGAGLRSSSRCLRRRSGAAGRSSLRLSAARSHSCSCRWRRRACPLSSRASPASS